MATARVQGRSLDRGRLLVTGVWLLDACARLPSTDERRPAGDGGELGRQAGVTAPALLPGPSPSGARAACAGALVAGYQYADLPEFWLGSREPTPAAVVGAGFFVSTDTRAGSSRARFSTLIAAQVSPEGYLEDAAGYRLLGYVREQNVGPCLGELRAPMFSNPEASTRIELAMNLDPRDVVLTFEAANASATANLSSSLSAFDSTGASHYVDIYFNNLGYNRYEYHVLVDGGDLEAGTPGVAVEVGGGLLVFEDSGWLSEVTNPPACFTFAGATPQCMEVDFPPVVVVGLNGYGQTTQLAADTAVFAQTVNGFAAGVGESISVDATGVVTVRFDSSAVLPIGRLALARFAREDELVELEQGAWEATRASGPPEWGVAGGAGRGRIERPPVTR